MTSSWRARARVDAVWRMRMRLVATLAVLLVRHQNHETAENVDEINEQLDAVPVNTRTREEIS